jgi:hypothetical protein
VNFSAVNSTSPTCGGTENVGDVEFTENTDRAMAI